MQLPLPVDQLKKILTDEGLVDSDRFDAMVREAERKNQSIIDVLVVNKVVQMDYMSGLMAKALGVERVDFEKRALDPAVVKTIPESIARQRQVILFHREDDGTYDAAMADPSDLETLEFLSQRFKAKVKPFLASNDDLNRGFSVYGYAVGQDFKKLIEENVRASLMNPAKNAAEAASGLPIVGIIDNILSYGIASRASDIHIEVLEDSIIIRYRIDGILYPMMEVPKAVHTGIAARIKILAGLKIDEHFAPQDGRFRYQVGSQSMDVRVSIIPTFHGEKVEMRLLSGAQKPLSLEEIGMLPDDVVKVATSLKKSYGMILSCGPTGSGKSTTLYTLMNMLNKPEINITSVEDPIEYNMRYVNQTQINAQAGITFASGLRALLRQDPNVIMVGEIRDSETADIAVEAALTGHLLLSSLHTNDAPTTVPRLFDLKIPPFLVGSVLTVVIAQRLVRKLCPTCVFSYEVTPDINDAIQKQAANVGEGIVIEPPKILFRGKGCSQCGTTGYRGRLGIFEILEVNDETKKIITSPDFDLKSIGDSARRGGMKTMFEDGIMKAQLALTTLEEVMRVIRE